MAPVVAETEAPVPAGQEVKDVARRLMEGIKGDDVSGLAAEIAYRFLFAVFPFGLFVAALGSFAAGWLHVENPAQMIVSGLGDNLPPSIAEGLRPELERLLGSHQAGLITFGALTALWAATGGTNALVKGIHRAYDVPEQRPFLMRYAVAIGLTIIAAAGAILSFVTIVGGAVVTQQAAERIGLGDQAFFLIQLLRWPAVFVVLTAAAAILYRYAPSVVVPWRAIVAGSAVFALGWLIATAAIGFYATNIANYGATYGSLGAVIVMMLWFYGSAAMLLIGAEVTAAITHERMPHEIKRRGEEQDAGARIEAATTDAKHAVKSAAGVR
jgi:membrane protein